MNTRILRMCRRSDIKADRSRYVDQLGQLQPTVFCWGRGGLLQFRAEDVAERHGEIRSCISVLTFRYHKPKIRKLFAELEHHFRNGTETPAARSWREYQEAQAALRQAVKTENSAKPALVDYDLFGQPIQQSEKHHSSRRY